MENLNPKTVNVVRCWEEEAAVTVGKPSYEGGKFALMALERATEDLQAGHIQALVTAPINKKYIQSEKFNYHGHTEYFEDKAQANGLMLLVHDDIRVGLVTGHIPLSAVAENISKESVLKKLKIMHKTLKTDFGILKPTIAVLGLNPHASDEGLMGNEEAEIIRPAIEAAKEAKVNAVGPFPADGFWGAGHHHKFDAVLAMYHDQGLIPFKALSFDEGVNYTAGLPFVRTSPDHGTGYDIAGMGKASHMSFHHALYKAIDIVNRRIAVGEMTANPLKKHALQKERG